MSFQVIGNIVLKNLFYIIPLFFLNSCFEKSDSDKQNTNKINENERIYIGISHNDASFSDNDCKKCIQNFISMYGGRPVDSFETLQISIENISEAEDKNKNIYLSWEIKLRKSAILGLGEAQDMILCSLSYNNNNVLNQVNQFKNQGKKFAKLFDDLPDDPEEQLKLILFGIESIKNIKVILKRNNLNLLY